jgi:hypothetical protein
VHARRERSACSAGYAGQPSSQTRAWRLLITVQKVGEEFKASNVEFLP